MARLVIWDAIAPSMTSCNDVGLEGADLGNNAVCYKQLKSMANGTTIEFRCHTGLYGSWVSLNKTASVQDHVYLHLVEVRVYEKREHNA